MTSKPPFCAQERSDTCMLACLRMLLAYRGTDITELALLQQISQWQGGLDPEQLSHLAQTHGLRAEAQRLDLDGIEDLALRILKSSARAGWRRKQYPVLRLPNGIDPRFSLGGTTSTPVSA